MKHKTKIPLTVNDSIYPAIAKKSWNLVFRAGFFLRESVDPAALKIAAADMRGRFPHFFSNLKKGLFNYYLSHNDNADVVEREISYCRPFNLKDTSRPNMRIIYNKNLLAVEIFHVITDGHGAVEFLKCLTAKYLELKNTAVPCDGNIIDFKSAAAEEEFEDASKKYRTKKFKVYKMPPAYQYRTLKKSEDLIVSSRDFSVEKIKTAAQKHGATITHYLQSALHCALYKQSNSQENLLTSVKTTISLRKIFPTKTLRNFSLYTNTQCRTDGSATIQSVADDTRDMFNKGVSKSRMQNFLNATAAVFGSPLWRIVPLPIKNIITRTFYKKSSSDYSVTLSNFGLINLPQAMQNQITGAQFIISDMPDKPVTCTAVSVADTLALFISSKDADNAFADRFFELIETDCI